MNRKYDNQKIKIFFYIFSYNFYLGKGIEFEKNIPFKMNSDYMDVLGGKNSALFSKFRKLFYRGFKAVRKHKEKILLLVKMMYSSHGNTLPCFKGGKFQ